MNGRGHLAATPLAGTSPARASGPPWPAASHPDRRGSVGVQPRRPAKQSRHRSFGRARHVAIAAVASVLIGSLTGPAAAQVGVTEFDPNEIEALFERRDAARAATAGTPNWTCFAPTDLPRQTLQGEGFVLNNLRLREANGTMSRRPYAELSFSVVNERSDSLFLTVQMVGYGSGETMPLIALSAEPSFSMVAAETVDQVKGSVNVRPGEVAGLNRVCLRVDG